MAHPKSRISRSRKRKRRTHKKITEPNYGICKTTGEPFQYHRAYEVDGNLYYKGKLLVQLDEVED